jgi:iron complex transport system permease protein
MKPIKAIQKRPVVLYLIAIGCWTLAVIASLKFGAVADASLELMMQLRLPRALLAGAVGIGLTVAGAALQALFANPLCEPYTLGISSGSALGAVIGAYLGAQSTLWSLAGISFPAFLGALIFGTLLYSIAHRMRQGSSALLLTGVMLGFLGSSLVALWMALADPTGIQNILFWLLGDLSRARLQGAVFTLVAVLILSLAIWRRSREMDAMLLGEEDALALGISVPEVRKKTILLTSLLVALCVSGAGMIGFVGLVIPHFARRLIGSLHFKLLPLAAILGAAALTWADVLARTVARPHELPVGVLTALLGAPFFISVLLYKPKTMEVRST